MTEHTILVIGGDDDETLKLAYDPDESKHCSIFVQFRDQTITAKSTDYFATLCEIREQLWRIKIIPFCYGASLNVYPSGMGRDMGRGLRAYKLTIGTHASELVDIFGTGSDVIPASVELQKEYFEDWLRSIRAHQAC